MMIASSFTKPVTSMRSGIIPTLILPILSLLKPALNLYLNVQAPAQVIYAPAIYNPTPVTPLPPTRVADNLIAEDTTASAYIGVAAFVFIALASSAMVLYSKFNHGFSSPPPSSPPSPPPSSSPPPESAGSPPSDIPDDPIPEEAPIGDGGDSGDPPPPPPTPPSTPDQLPELPDLERQDKWCQMIMSIIYISLIARIVFSNMHFTATDSVPIPPTVIAPSELLARGSTPLYTNSSSPKNWIPLPIEPPTPAPAYVRVENMPTCPVPPFRLVEDVLKPSATLPLAATATIPERITSVPTMESDSDFWTRFPVFIGAGSALITVVAYAFLLISEQTVEGHENVKSTPPQTEPMTVQDTPMVAPESVTPAKPKRLPTNWRIANNQIRKMKNRPTAKRDAAPVAKNVSAAHTTSEAEATAIKTRPIVECDAAQVAKDIPAMHTPSAVKTVTTDMRPDIERDVAQATKDVPGGLTPSVAKATSTNINNIRPIVERDTTIVVKNASAEPTPLVAKAISTMRPSAGRDATPIAKDAPAEPTPLNIETPKPKPSLKTSQMVENPPDEVPALEKPSIHAPAPAPAPIAANSNYTYVPTSNPFPKPSKNPFAATSASIAHLVPRPRTISPPSTLDQTKSEQKPLEATKQTPSMWAPKSRDEAMTSTTASAGRKRKNHTRTKRGKNA